jgi:hypothetical protein
MHDDIDKKLAAMARALRKYPKRFAPPAEVGAPAYDFYPTDQEAAVLRGAPSVYGAIDPSTGRIVDLSGQVSHVYWTTGPSTTAAGSHTHTIMPPDNYGHTYVVPNAGSFRFGNSSFPTIS